MSAIVSRGRRGHTVVPNWRWEDPTLDAFDLRIAGWLASHADGYVEAYVTRNEIARRLDLSGDRVSKSLARLEAAQIVMVDAEEGGRGRLHITFDWDVWQTDRSPHDRSTGRHTTSDRSPHDHIEEQGEEQKEKDTSSSDDDVDLQFEFNFAEFWKMYPRKTGKPAAKKVLRRLWSKGHLAMEDAPAVIATGLAKWVEYWNAERTEQKFVPHPTTWLNQRRWEDGPPTAKAAEATGPAVPHEHYSAFMSGLPFFEEYAPRIANDPQQRIRVLEAVATVARWGYAPGETMVRLAILARWEDLTAIMTPSKIANVPKVDRFTGMPEQNQNDPPGLVASMRRAYQLQQWKHWEQ